MMAATAGEPEPEPGPTVVEDISGGSGLDLVQQQNSDALRDLRGSRCILGTDEYSSDSSDDDGGLCATCSGCDCAFGREARLSSSFHLAPSASSSPYTPGRDRHALSRALSSPSARGSSPRQRPRRTSSELEQFRTLQKRNRELKLQMRDSAGRQRALDALVRPEDLQATREDVAMHGEKVTWQLCGVNDPGRGATPKEIRSCRRKVKRRRERAIEMGDMDKGDDSSSDGEDACMGTGGTGGTGTAGGATGMSTASGGAHGMVWRALWQDRIQVAIKTNRDRMMSNTDEIQLFLDLRHPNIVTCYGILKQQIGMITRESIVTERCTTTLDGFLKDNSRWLGQHGVALTTNHMDMCKLTILEHVALGLERLHSECVLHRDLKPLNILLDGAAPGMHCESCGHEGRWKICDFGEAAILRTPTLSFAEAMAWSSQLLPSRFQKITSVELIEHGARHYAWVHPGETFGSLAAQASGGSGELAHQTTRDIATLEWTELQSRARELGVPGDWVDSAEYPQVLLDMVITPRPPCSCKHCIRPEDLTGSARQQGEKSFPIWSSGVLVQRGYRCSGHERLRVSGQPKHSTGRNGGSIYFSEDTQALLPRSHRGS